MKLWDTKSAAYQAARRGLKQRFGKSYMPKQGVDFILCNITYGENFGKWRIEFMV